MSPWPQWTPENRTSIDAETIAGWIHEARKAGLSMAELADLSGVSIRNLRRIANGHQTITFLNTADRIADATGHQLWEVGR